MLRTSSLIVSAMVAIAAMPSSAAQQSPAIRPSSPIRISQTSVRSIAGSVWKADNTPAVNVAVRLRNLRTTAIDALSRSNAGGEFEFSDVAAGVYAVEIVDDKDRVIAVGHPITVVPGETVATFIRIGARTRWFTELFGNAAAAAIATAAGLGVTAMAPTGEEISPGR